MKLKLSLSIVIQFLITFAPIRAWAIHQISPSQRVDVPIKRENFNKEELNFNKIAFIFLKRQLRKSSFKNNKPVKKKVDSFAIASIVSLFGTLLIGSSIALATFFLGLSLVFGLISIIRISQKPQERGGAVFAVLGILLGIIILVAIKKTFR